MNHERREAIHIVFINQYYPPDGGPLGAMLEAVAEVFVEAGHRVTVICAGEGAEDRAGGLEVVRIGGAQRGKRGVFVRAIHYVSFCRGVVRALLRLKSKPDLIVALGSPPYLGLIARGVSKVRGGRHSHWITEMYPELMVARGRVLQGGFNHLILQTLFQWSIGGRRCVALLSPGPTMAKELDHYVDFMTKHQWVPLWEIESDEVSNDEVLALREERGWEEEEMVVLYSGDMGPEHRFDDILQVSLEVAEWGIRFAFFGAGPRRLEIEKFAQQHPNAAIEVHDDVPPESYRLHLATGDLHLISLRPEWDFASMTNQLQRIFAAERPVLFTGSATCSLTKWIRASGGGWAAIPGDLEAHRRIIDAAYDPEERWLRGKAAKHYGEIFFNRKKNPHKIAEILSQIELPVPTVIEASQLTEVEKVKIRQKGNDSEVLIL